MNQIVTLWRMQLRSMRNAGRQDARIQLAIGAGLLFSLAMGVWGLTRLLVLLQQWQAQGPATVQMGLWGLCLGTWSGMACFTIVGTLQQTLSTDESLLLFTLPIEPAACFRAIYGTFFLKNLWTWILLELGVTGYALVVTLGWQALSWLVLLQLGVGVIVCCGLLVTWLVVRYLIGREQRTRLIAVLLMVALASGLLAALGLKIHPATLQAFGVWLRPEFMIMLLLLLLVLLLGPLAAPLGRLYAAAFYTTQRWDRARNVITLPGIRLLYRLCGWQRNLTGALFGKMLLNQGRNVFFWLRIVIVAVILAFFPFVRSMFVHAGFSATLIVVAYAAGLAVLHAIEVAPNAISGEGSRLTLYLVAPLDLADILRAKLMLFLVPLVGEALIVGIVLSVWSGLVLSEAVFACMAVVLIVTNTIALLVLASAWDEDLSLVVEGWLQLLMQEEVPFSPRRMWLLGIAVLLFAAMVLTVWKLPSLLVLGILVVLSGSILVGVQQMSKMHMRQLLRRG